MSRSLNTTLGALAIAAIAGTANAATMDVNGARVSGKTDVQIVIADALSQMGVETTTWWKGRSDKAGGHPVYSFDVTRVRKEKDGTTRLFHWRSGLKLSVAESEAVVKNLIINDKRGYITGKIEGDTQRRVLFRYGEDGYDNGDGDLYMTMMLAGGLNKLLDTDLALTKTHLGGSNTDWAVGEVLNSEGEGEGEGGMSPGVVPVPAAGALLLTGLGAAWASRRRSKS